MRSLLAGPADRGACILDSCRVGNQDSHLLIAGIDPIRTITVQDDPVAAIETLDEIVQGGSAAIFTLSYDLGRLIQNVETRHQADVEPLVYAALFDRLTIHDYATGISPLVETSSIEDPPSSIQTPTSNLSRDQYIQAVEMVREEIRRGNTYQANLTRKITTKIPADLIPSAIFTRLRRDHPAPFSAFIERGDSTVISASPERFFKIEGDVISASPIKGTRPRGTTEAEHVRLREELLHSAKDRAENVMIVDLLRNDLGRVCEFGSVEVESLCEIEELPSLFHLVSTITGRLRDGIKFGDVLRSLFPCGSITGAPKINTMRILDAIEPAARGLSMGAIGCYIPESFGISRTIDLSVAIRTMVIRDGTATFNVGGGIVVDSDPGKEWDETVVKSKALLNSLGLQV